MKTISINDHLELKEIQLSDALDIFQSINKERASLRTWLPFVDFTIELEDSEHFIESIISVPVENREFVFVIREDKQFAGIVGFRGSDLFNRKTEIGYWLDPNFQKKGIMVRSVLELLKFAFHDLNMNRVEIRCALENFPSRAIPEKLGFILEGFERSGEFLANQKFTDLAVYSLLKEEF
jgi:ribosomal-protein-serine acetyltransferase